MTETAQPVLEGEFAPGVRLPEGGQPENPAMWFAFRGDKLLVCTTETGASLPSWSAIATLGSDFERRHFLGHLGGDPCFAVEVAGEAPAPEGHAFETLRPLHGRLPDRHFSLAGRAAQILTWDRTHQFCGQCGTPTERVEGERAKRCPSCGLLNYPRLSPAIIVLIRKGEHILLARNANSPSGAFSVLAGFVEPGESLEETVAREVMEEVGIEVADIRYFGSQPWPFPHQLMVGFTATYARGELHPDGVEIQEAGWYLPSELPRVPPGLSIARWLIDSARASSGSA